MNLKTNATKKTPNHSIELIGRKPSRRLTSRQIPAKFTWAWQTVDMNISLSPEVQRRIERTLSEGRYESANDLVLKALDALESAHEESPEHAQRYDSEISDALREIERGEYTDYSQEELSHVFECARTQGLELLAKAQPHRIASQDPT